MEQPNEHNVSYLLRSENGELHLKRNHSYFTQCQGQMAITERKWCHFFLYSLAGYCLLEIAFDEIWWNEMQSYLVYFFVNYLSNKIFNVSHKSDLQHSNSEASVDVYELSKDVINPDMSDMGADESYFPWVGSDFEEVVGPGPSVNPAPSAESILPLEHRPSVEPGTSTNVVTNKTLCPICKNECLAKYKTFGQNSIECEKCLYWHHMKCVSIKTKKQLAKVGQTWFCKSCSSNN